MSGSPHGSPNGGCPFRGPPASSLRLKLGAVRLPAEGSLDMLGDPAPPVAPAVTTAGKLRLRLRATAAEERNDQAPTSSDAAIGGQPEPAEKAHRREAADPGRVPSGSHEPGRAAIPAAAAVATASATAGPTAAASNAAPKPAHARRPPPPFPSAPQPAQTVSSNARLEKPTPPGKRPAPKVVPAPSVGTALSYAKRSPAVEAGPPIVPLTKVKVPVLKDELSKYDVQRKVGEGTYGEVYLARERQSGLPVAIKKLKVLEQMEGLPNTTLREITILQSLKAFNECKHFAALREVVMAPDYRSLHLVFEFVEHSLYGLMAQGMRFTEADYRCVFRQVLRGLAVLHEAHIVHRDIKPNNILVDNAGNVKLCDFGLAFSTTAGRNRITPRLVALAYRPPEMLLNASSYSSSVDIWSVGCMLAQVYLGGSPPFMRSASQPADSEVEQLALVGGLRPAGRTRQRAARHGPRRGRARLPRHAERAAPRIPLGAAHCDDGARAEAAAYSEAGDYNHLQSADPRPSAPAVRARAPSLGLVHELGQ